MSTAVVTDQDVYNFWIKPMSDPGSKLKELYRKYSKVGGTITPGYNAKIAEHRDARLIENLQKNFNREDFVILKYESWMGKIGPNPSAFLNFFFRNVGRNNSDLTEVQPGIFSHKNPSSKMDIEARKFASGDFPPEFWNELTGRTPESERISIQKSGTYAENRFLTAAFSKSKIWIGFEIVDTYQLAGILHADVAAEDAFCFSWCESDPQNPPGNHFLGPWAQSKIASHGKYVPIQEIALFRELIVRSNKKFINQHILTPY